MHVAGSSGPPSPVAVAAPECTSREDVVARRARVCRSWAAGAVGAVGKPPRRARVCRSWYGYGTLVEEPEVDQGPTPLAAMKPPGPGGGGGGRWRDAMPTLRSLVARRSPPVDGPDTPSRVPLMHGAAALSTSSPSVTLVGLDAAELGGSRNSEIGSRHSGSGSRDSELGGSRQSDVGSARLSQPGGSRHSELAGSRHATQAASYDPLPRSSANLTDSPTLRKCSTLGALQPLRAVNRLRPGSAVCSRCSSLLSLASSSRYSLHAGGGGFVPVDGRAVDLVLCKLCLAEVPRTDTAGIAQCACLFCKDCVQCYVEFEISEGAYDISCPDAQCPRQGVFSLAEVERLVSQRSMEKYRRYRLNREVDMDVSRLWCPKAGCETICHICPAAERCLPQSVRCPTCSCDFCSNCKHPWHGGITCEENTRLSNLLTKEPGIPFDNDLIKCCPMCNVPIEKDEGCAQMMCKRCKHVFCWYCLASLDDDFLLRHYDKGPCKNKLGHSRASVIWHRTQVIGIFAGFGILLLVASPLLLLAAPCIVCCKCRVCSGGGKLDSDDDA